MLWTLAVLSRTPVPIIIVNGEGEGEARSVCLTPAIHQSLPTRKIWYANVLQRSIPRCVLLEAHDLTLRGLDINRRSERDAREDEGLELSIPSATIRLW